jgi:hypothetical protein
MSTQADQLGERVIVTGRAYVRIIEAADLLLDCDPVGIERVLRLAAEQPVANLDPNFMAYPGRYDPEQYKHAASSQETE